MNYLADGQTDWGVLFLILLLVGAWAGIMFYLARFLYRSLRGVHVSEVTQPISDDAYPANAPSRVPLDYETSLTAAARVMRPSAVVILSAMPGLSSVLLRGRAALPRALLLILLLAALPIVTRIVGIFFFPYLHHELRYWSQTFLFWGGAAAIFWLSARRGLQDRLDLIAKGEVPAYRHTRRVASPILILLGFVALILLAFLGLAVLALGGLSAAK